MNRKDSRQNAALVAVWLLGWMLYSATAARSDRSGLPAETAGAWPARGVRSLPLSGIGGVRRLGLLVKRHQHTMHRLVPRTLLRLVDQLGEGVAEFFRLGRGEA